LFATIQGIGQLSATAFAATIPDPSAFRSGREFAAWLGLTPRQNSSGASTGSVASASKVAVIFAICSFWERALWFGGKMSLKV
jgi:transposase